MEEIYFPSHLIEELEKHQNFKLKYKNDTVIAFNSEQARVLSDFQSLLEQSESPQQSFHREATIFPTKSISDAFIYNSGVYFTSENSSKGFISRWSGGDSISVHRQDQVSQEFLIEFDSKIIAHSAMASSDSKDYLIVLTQNENTLSFYDLEDERLVLKYSLSEEKLGNNIVIEEASIFTIDFHDIVVIHINKTHLLLIDFKHKKVPLLIDFCQDKVKTVHSILGTPYILIVSEKPEEEYSQTQFHAFKMFKDESKYSICSNEDEVDVPTSLKSIINEEKVLDSCYIGSID